MRPTFLFVLVIVGVCLVICMCAGKICGGEEYTIVDSNGSFIRCLPCGKCHPGFGVEPRCGSKVQHPPVITCNPCKPGTFSSLYDSSPCYACHQCAKHQSITAHCSNKSDTVCSDKCKKGYYLRKKAPHNCQKCSACCLDGKDEKITECVDQGLNVQCSPRPDKVNCGSSDASGTGASKGSGPSTVIVITGVLGPLVIVVLVIVAVYMCHRRRKRNRQQSQPPEASAEEQRNGETPHHAYASEGPQTELSTDPKVKFFPASHAENPTYQGTPTMSHHARKHDIPGSKKLAAAEQHVKLPDEKESDKPILCRQSSQDSQNSGDGGFRKRSGSAISFEKLKRKVSERDDSLLEEESPEETHEPIKIANHPKSQTAKEGAKVELKCRVEGKSTKLMFQWFKDGVAVIGKNEAVLVLDSVELRNFGRYTCYVSYQDLYGEGVESLPAILDVTPQCRNGMRPKLLTELDINTREEVASLLENKRFSLGGCRQVAEKYGMKDHQIGTLDNSKEPGNHVLEFLKGSKPNLTVYDFCKMLKEDNMKRLDIVKHLEDHFLVRQGSEYV